MINKSKTLAEKIVNYIKASVPLEMENGTRLEINNIKVNIPESNYDIDNQLQMKYTGSGSTEGYVSGTVKIIDNAGKTVHNGHYAKLVTFPICTERGSYIINGIEKSIIPQMRMKAGCYTSLKKDTGAVKTQLRFKRNGRPGQYMPAISFSIIPSTNAFNVEIKSFKNYNFNVINFLNLLGFTDAEIKQSLGNNDIADAILVANQKKRNQYSINDLFKIFFPRSSSGENVSAAKKREMILSFFAENASFGDGSVISSTLGLNKNNTCLNKQILSKAVKKTVSVYANLIPEDIKDETKYKDIYSDSDLIFESITNGLDKFFESAKNKMENLEFVKKGGVSVLTGMQNTIHNGLTSRNGLLSSELCIASEEINPLFMEAKQREITQGGPDGMNKDSMRNETDARNLNSSGINKIDPVETPESGKIGFTQHLTVGAKIEDHTIKSEFLKVVNGEALVGKENKIRLGLKEEEDSIIAYNDSRYIERDGNKYVFTQDLVPGRYRGKNDMYPVSKIKYMDSEAHNLVGTAANMIPFVAHDDGARALMGAGMQKQAVPLVHRESPLVTTLADSQTGETFDQKVGREYGKPVISNISGTVQKITNSKIIVLGNDGKEHSHSYYNYYPLNQSYINNELKVKVGETVNKGQLLAEGWQTDNGKLALGKNARIAYIPYKGYNYEDGMVISKSFSEAMTSDEYDEIEMLIPKGALGGRGSNVKSDLMKETTSASLSLFDEDGIIKIGTEIKAGSVLVGFLKEIAKDSDDLIDLISMGSGKIKYKYSEKNVPAGSYVAGIVHRITVVNNPDAVNKQKLIFSIVNKKPLKFGDKVAGRHGNKGTITKVLDDKLMPVGEDGKIIDIMISPLGVPSRKNTGQLLEAGAGLIAESNGKPFVVNNFNHKEKDRVKEELKKIGYPDGKMKVILKEEDEKGRIIDVPVEVPITVGVSYMMKLKHKVDDKIQSRSNRETPLTQKTHMPMKLVGTAQGEKSNPQRLGEMEMRALQAHGAAWNLLESQTIKADGGGDAKCKAAIFKAIATGNLDAAELSKSATPETVKVLSDSLKLYGLNVKPMYNGVSVVMDKPFNSIGLVPLNQDEFIKTIGEDKEVYTSKILDARKLYGDKNTKSSKEKRTAPDQKGGLLDTNIFGEGTDEDRNKWGYIKLPMPVANPLFMEDSSNNIYKEITGLDTNTIKQLAAPSGITGGDKGPKAIITDVSDLESSLTRIEDEDLRKEYRQQFADNMKKHGFKTGDIVPVETLDKLKEQGINIPYRTGGFALEYLLKSVDIDKGLETAKKELDAASNSTTIPKAYKKVKAFEMLKHNNLKAEDLMIKYLPVAPSYLRPIIPNEKTRSVLVNDLNKLYGKVINAKQIAEKEAVLKNDGTLDNVGLAPRDFAQRNKVLYDSIKMFQGRIEAKDGDKKLSSVNDTLGGKFGLVRKEMLAKREDFSGRSVITVDPNLKLNEVGIPLDMAKQLYKPFIIKGLVDKGICKNETEAESKLNKPDKSVKKVIQEIADDRLVFLNRQPSLHKFSMQAMKAIIREYESGTAIRSIQLNPLVVTGFNADFDGDTMAAHIPITERAKEEAKRVAIPSNNLINPTDGKMVIEIRHEMALGIYQLTNHWKNPKGKVMVFKNYKELLNAYLLGKITHDQRVKVPFEMKEITAGQALFNWLIPDRIKKFRNTRQTWGRKQIMNMIEKVYEESEATNFKLISKLEIANFMDSIKDLGFKASTRTGLSLGINDFTFKNDVKTKIDDIMAKGNPNDADSWTKVENEIESKLKDGLLPDDNPLQVMMTSGARANPQQIRKMFATIGVGKDVSLNTLSPIKNSHFDGLSPQDYYTLGKDSRKGMYDRSVSTEAPGALTRDVWSATQDIVINEKDCKTKEFVNIKKGDGTIKGRIAGKDILSSDGKVICKRNQMITSEIYRKIYNDDTIDYVPVRSPLRCKTPNGKCQYCYGAMAGTTELVKIGTAIGVIASQAIGEPVTQMTMNTFHTGGANSAATLGLPRVKNILNLSTKPSNKSLLAEQSGTVDSIIETPTEIVVMIGKRKHVLKKIPGKTTPSLKVKRGDIVKKGDFLTYGDSSDISSFSDGHKTTMILTNADPRKMFELKTQSLGQDQALKDTRDYLTNTMQYSIKASNAYMDRRHAETIVSKLTGTALIIDAGDSPYMKGQKGDVNLFNRWNEENCKGTKSVKISPIEYQKLIGRTLVNDVIKDNKILMSKGHVISPKDASIISKLSNSVSVTCKPIQCEVLMQGQSAASVNGGWFGDMGSTNSGGLVGTLARGAATGSVDKLEDPRSRLMAGKMLNIGEGANLTNEFKDKFTNKMSNFFNSKIKIDKYLKKSK